MSYNNLILCMYCLQIKLFLSLLEISILVFFKKQEKKEDFF